MTLWHFDDALQDVSKNVKLMDETIEELQKTKKEHEAVKEAKEILEAEQKKFNELQVFIIQHQPDTCVSGQRAVWTETAQGSARQYRRVGRAGEAQEGYQTKGPRRSYARERPTKATSSCNEFCHG